MKENIHSEKKTLYTDSNLHRYIIVPVEYILYGYQESELNHMLDDIVAIKLIILVFRCQKNRVAGVSSMSISAFRALPVPVSPEEKRAAKRRREEEEYEEIVAQMERDMPEIVIDSERSKKDPDYIYFQATDSEDSDSDVGEDENSNKRRRNMVDLITVALIANKYGVFHRAAAAIATAVLIDNSVAT